MAGVAPEDLQAIILAIHRTALDPREGQTVLDLLAKVTGGAHMHLFGHDAATGAGVMLARDGDRIVALGGNIRRRDIDRMEGEFVSLLEQLAPHLRVAPDVAQRGRRRWNRAILSATVRAR